MPPLIDGEGETLFDLDVPFCEALDMILTGATDGVGPGDDDEEADGVDDTKEAGIDAAPMLGDFGITGRGVLATMASILA